MRTFAITLLTLFSIAESRAVVTGTVTDATSGAPILKFSTVARPDSPRSIWQQHTVQHFIDGNLQITRRLWDTTQIRVWATGYRPAVVTVKKDVDAALRIALQPDTGVSGTVVNQAGKPVGGAAVALATLTSEPNVADGKLTLSGSAKAMGIVPVITGGDGDFTLPAEIDPARVVVVHESGFADVDLSDLKKPVVLQPWGRVQGRLMLGAKAGADWIVGLSRTSGDEPGVRCFKQVTTDAQGNFDLERVPAGRVNLYPMMKVDKYTCPPLGTRATIEVRPGAATAVTLGGVGRPVIGRLVAADGAKVDWSKLPIRIQPPAPHLGFPGDDEMWKAQVAFFQAAGALYHHKITPDPDGRFRIERLPQGNYEIYDAFLTGGQDRFDVPPMEGGMSDEPLDLGELMVGRINRLQSTTRP